MLNEVKHLGRKREVSIAPERTYDPRSSAPLRMTIII